MPESFFNKLRHQACNFIKKETLGQVFSCEFCEISKNTFLTKHLRATASGDLVFLVLQFYHDFSVILEKIC